MKPGVFAICILIASASQSSAQAIANGNDIREACQFAARGPENELELSKASFCKGFVKTIISVGRRLNKPDSFCAPDGVTVGQAINVFLKYLNDNPDKAQQAAADLAITAFGTAWRCK
jgi:Rap1a immunity proteins